MGSMAMGVLKKLGKGAKKKVESDMKDSAAGKMYQGYKDYQKKKKARKA